MNFDANMTAENIFSNIAPVDITVNFFVGNTMVASAAGGDIVNGPNHSFTFLTFTSTTSLPHGQLSIVGKSTGDASYAPSTSAPITVTVLYPTNLALNSSNPMAQRGTNVTFTAQLTSSQTGAPPITGSVQFASDGVPLGSTNLANGQAQFTTSSLAAGTHTISAQYAGDSNYFMSNNQTTETINLLNSITSITTSSPSIQQGQSVTFTAHTAPGQAGGPALTGTVQFSSAPSMTGSLTPLGSAPLSNGQATISTTALPLNTQFVFAGYSGDSNYASSSGSVSQTVTPGPDFSVAANPQTINISSPGSMGSTTLTFTALNGFTGTINLSPSACSGLPSESSCSFSVSSITFGGAAATPGMNRPARETTTGTTMTATLTVSTMAPSSAMPQTKHSPPPLGPAATLFAAIISLLFLVRASSNWKKWQTDFAAFLAIATLLSFAACGGGGGPTGPPPNPGTPVGLDPNVVISLSSGAVSHNLPLSVNVE
ncbi:MAG: Ig-like domain-containing protein [Candidatus Acidiferrales bacterium]